MVYANTYEQWMAARAAGQERPWCEEHFVSFTAMSTIARTRDQLRDTLGRCGITEGRAGPPTGSRRLVLLRAVVTVALWPSAALVAGFHPKRSKDAEGNIIMGSELELHIRDNFGLHPHPTSTTAQLLEEELGALSVAMYQSKVMTTQLFVDKTTMVSPLTAVLFGAHAGCYDPPSHDRGNGAVGLVQEGWIAFRAHADVALNVLRLRAGVDLLVAESVGAGGRGAGDGKPSVADSEEAMAFVGAIAELLEVEQGLN